MSDDKKKLSPSNTGGSFRKVKGFFSRSKNESTGSASSSNPFADPEEPPPAYSSAPPAQAQAQASSSTSTSNPFSSANIQKGALATDSKPAQDSAYSFDAIRSAVKASAASHDASRHNGAAPIDNSFLRHFDTVFLIDDSGSMKLAETFGSLTKRWERAGDVLEDFVKECIKYDEDGIDIFFINQVEPGNPLSRGFNNGRTDGHRNIDSLDKVKRIFRDSEPNGLTPTGKSLKLLLKEYIDSWAKAPNQGKPKPVNIIVITDGVPTDEKLLTKSLVDAARRLDELGAPLFQVGVQFFQIGDDHAATKALQKLDDELAKEAQKLGGGSPVEMRDMVDATCAAPGSRLTQQAITKVLVGAIDKRIDRQSTRQ